MVELPIPGDLPAYALRGGKRDAAILFLTGMCSDPLGYAQAFQHAAAEHGILLALQGDVSCGGDFRRWSADTNVMMRRIAAVFAAARVPERDVTLIGYSQGAERAERLVATRPETFTRVVLISSPVVPAATHLSRAQAVVLMAGSRESQGTMKAGLANLRRAHIPVIFMEIPGARHGQLGDDPDTTFRRVFSWLDENGNAPVTPRTAGR
jgi:pimeloyl-ACP methyl ester carboxylesterase